MPCKVTFFFNQAQQGWTETWYSPSSDPVQFAGTWKAPDFQSLVLWRSAPTELFAMRVTTLTNPRLSVSVPLSGKYFGSGNLPFAFKPDPASTDAMYAVRGFLGKRRQLPMRGLLDDMVQRDSSGRDIETPLLKTGIDTYMGTIVAKNLGMLYQKRAGAAVNPPVQVAAVAADPGNINASILTCINAPNLALPVPRLMTALGVPTNDLPGFPKNVTVMAVSVGPPHTITVAYRFRASTIIVNPPKMRVLEQETGIDGPASWGFIGYHERKTGRPFGVPRGRARALVKAH